MQSQNVLVDENWNCKVADFGMSRLKTLTATMTRVGTPQWMAPEVRGRFQIFFFSEICRKPADCT